MRCTFSVMFSMVRSLRTGTVEASALLEDAIVGGELEG